MVVLKKIGVVLPVIILIALFLSPLGIMYYAARTQRFILFLVFSGISLFYAYFYFKGLISVFDDEEKEDDVYKVSLTFKVIMSLGIICFGWLMLLGRALSSVNLESMGNDIFYAILLIYFFYHVVVIAYNEHHREKASVQDSAEEPE